MMAATVCRRSINRAGVPGAAFVTAWFLWFAWSGLSAGFAPDDMMNLHTYWRLGPWHALASQFMIGTNAYRPLGALFYLPLYSLFGLNPLPFRAVVMVILALNVWLTYRTARRLGSGGLASMLAAIVVCYHAGLGDLHSSTATIYDVLCYCFYLAAFLYCTGRPIEGWRRWAAFLALYLCALNAKEMAVTLPVMLLVYGWLYRPKHPLWRPALVAGAITGLYIAGKMFGADPLMAMDTYRPVFTLERFLASSRLQTNHLLYTGTGLDTARLLALWAVMAYIAFRRPRPELRFAWAMILISPLPVVFLQGRTNSCLYLPLAGWAVFMGAVAVDVIRAVAGWLEHEPLIGRLGRTALAWIMIAALLLAYGRLTARNKRWRAPALAADGRQTAAVIAQLRAANAKAAPHSWVLLINDPFSQFDAKFIAELYFGERSVTVWLQNKTPFPEQEVREKMQYVYRFEPGALVRLKP